MHNTSSADDDKVEDATENQTACGSGRIYTTPVNKIDKVAHIDNYMSPNQPTDCSAIPFQQHKVKGKLKELRFQSVWFHNYPWLHYDNSIQGVVCFSCCKAQRNGLLQLAKCAEATFTSTGFSNWKKALTKFQQHQSSSTHRLSVAQLAHVGVQGSVNALLSEQVTQDQLVALKCMKAIFTSIKYLARQGLAIRGGEADSGNFRELLLLRSCDIPELKAWIEKKTNFTSPERQNEILKMFAHNILRNICCTIKAESKTFSIIIDGTQDVAGIEQESICLRYVDRDFQPHEVFLGFYQSNDTTGQGTANIVKDALLRLDLSLDNLRFQTYDGAASMSGTYNGCQAIIKKEQPLALYVHCGAHVTHLVASSASFSVPLVRDALQLVQDLGNLYKSSGKIKSIFQRGNEDFDMTGGNQHEVFETLKPLCPTRWLSRCAAVMPILAQYAHVIKSLTTSSEELTGETAIRASSLAKRFQDASVLLGLEMAMKVLPLLEKLNKSLQSPTMTVCGMMNAVACLKDEFQRMRSDSEFLDLIRRVNAIVDELELEPLRLPRQKKVPARYTGQAADHVATTIDDHFRPKYFELMDNTILQLEQRFSAPDLQTYGLMETVLVSSKITAEAEVMLKQYPEIQLDYLKAELDIFHRNFKRKLTSVSQIVEHTRTLSKEVQSYVPSVMALLHLLLLCPASSAQAERSFSSLRRLKTWLRNTMSQKRLNFVAVCHIHQTILDRIDTDALLKDFVQQSDIRQKIFGMMT
jgi:hypothetical protein